VPRPRPWWPEPLDQWARELREHGGGGGLTRWIDEHPDEIEAFMKGFLRSDTPDAYLWAEPVYRLKPCVRLTPAQRRKRAIIDNLPVEKQRLICAAGRVLWRGFVTIPRGERHLSATTLKERANQVAGAVIEEMCDLFGPDHRRLKSAGAVSLMFIGERPSTRQMQNFAKANPSRTDKRRRQR
jgi:hypothetical protein